MSLNEFECMLCWDVALGCFKQRLFLFNVGGGAPSRRQLSTHNDEFDGSRWMRQNANLSPSRYSVCKMNIDIRKPMNLKKGPIWCNMWSVITDHTHFDNSVWERQQKGSQTESARSARQDCRVGLLYLWHFPNDQTNGNWGLPIQGLFYTLS